MGAHDIQAVAEPDLPDLLPLMRAYCEFYEVAPSDDDLLAMARVLIADPEREGLQLLARDAEGRAIGFATVFWTWTTLSASRLGADERPLRGRGRRAARAWPTTLIAACAERCRERGASSLVWQTARDNHRAQAVYERVGGERDDRWLDYSLDVSPGATTPDS